MARMGTKQVIAGVVAQRTVITSIVKALVLLTRIVYRFSSFKHRWSMSLSAVTEVTGCCERIEMTCGTSLRSGSALVIKRQSRSPHGAECRATGIHAVTRLPSAKSISSTFATASSCMCGRTWAYVSSVKAALACPSCSDTTFGGTMASRSGRRPRRDNLVCG
jgi:hypothetical protein